VTRARAVHLNVALKTARLELEPLTSAHADALFAPMQDPRLYTWTSSLPPATVEQLRERWTRLESRMVPDWTEALLTWAVKRTSDGAYVGKVDANVRADVATNIGYEFFVEYWHNGYARESVLGVLEHLEKDGIRQAWATVTLGNDASARVLESLGFRQTRVLPNNEMIRGALHDDVEYVRDGARAEPG